jgi:HEXXH motif-containing protein
MEVLSAWAESSDGWAPSLGSLESAALAEDAGSLRRAAAELALWAHDHGTAGRWTTRFEEPMTFRLGSSAVIRARKLQVDARPHQYRVRWLDDAGSSRSVAVNARVPSRMPSLLEGQFGGRVVRVVLRGDKEGLAGLRFLDEDDWEVAQEASGFLETLARLDAALARHSPAYHGWVRRLLRAIVLTEAREGQIESGSSRQLPGLVHVSRTRHVPVLAEMLAHELSHQHYYVATRLGPVDDGSDSTLYYSPVKRRGRPIANILLAYHAFGNVVLLMRDLLASGFRDGTGYVEANEREICELLAKLEIGLKASPALTPIGEALYLPLAERLQQKQ